MIRGGPPVPAPMVRGGPPVPTPIRGGELPSGPPVPTPMVRGGCSEGVVVVAGSNIMVP